MALKPAKRLILGAKIKRYAQNVFNFFQQILLQILHCLECREVNFAANFAIQNAHFALRVSACQ